MAATATERRGQERPQRLFFALWPAAATATVLWQWAQDLHSDCGGRMPPRANLHLTLAFLGAVMPVRQGALAALAATVAAGAAPFSLTLDRIGCWRRQGIVWAGSHDVPAALRVLAGRLDEGLRASGFATERRTFKPHVTLLRDAAGSPRTTAAGPLHWTVNDVVLACSGRGAQGPRYQVIGRWPLTARL